MGADYWAWSVRKDALNRQKHSISFATASLVFCDPYHRSFHDSCSHEERWQTYGLVHGILIVVIHTEPVLSGDALLAPGRIISARKATKQERRAFEERSDD